MTGFQFHPGEGGVSDAANVGIKTEAKIAAFRREHYGAIGSKVTDLLGIKP